MCTIPAPLLQVWVEVQQHPMHLPKGVLQCMCACTTMCAAMQVCSLSLLRESAMLCCSLLQASDLYAGSRGVAARECRHLEAMRERGGCRFVEHGWPYMLPVAALRTRSQDEQRCYLPSK